MHTAIGTWAGIGGHVATVRANFAANLRRLLRKRGMRQKDLADKLGVSAPIVSKWVKGHAVPEWDRVDEIAIALHEPASALFRDIDAEDSDINAIDLLRDIAVRLGLDVMKKK